MRNIVTAIALMALPIAAHAAQPEKFGAYDTNRDNIISKAEAASYHQMIFDKMDTNGDGKVTPTEFKVYQKANRRHAWNVETSQK